MGKFTLADLEKRIQERAKEALRNLIRAR